MCDVKVCFIEDVESGIIDGGDARPDEIDKSCCSIVGLGYGIIIFLGGGRNQIIRYVCDVKVGFLDDVDFGIIGGGDVWPDDGFCKFFFGRLPISCSHNCVCRHVVTHYSIYKIWFWKVKNQGV